MTGPANQVITYEQAVKRAEARYQEKKGNARDVPLALEAPVDQLGRPHSR
jgi:hypothetical protein